MSWRSEEVVSKKEAKGTNRESTMGKLFQNSRVGHSSKWGRETSKVTVSGEKWP